MIKIYGVEDKQAIQVDNAYVKVKENEHTKPIVEEIKNDGTIIVSHTQPLGFVSGDPTVRNEAYQLTTANEAKTPYPKDGESVVLNKNIYTTSDIKVTISKGNIETPIINKTINLANNSATLTTTAQVADEGYVYLDADNKNATPITVTASELTNGNLNINSNSTNSAAEYDITNYKTVTVAPINKITHEKPIASIPDANGKISVYHVVEESGYMEEGTTKSEYNLATSSQTTPLAPTEEIQIAAPALTYNLNDIKVAAIPSTYVGSAIEKHTQDSINNQKDNLLDEETVTIPNGYYDEDVTINMPTSAIVLTPSTEIKSNENKAVINITASANPGYITSDNSSISLSNPIEIKAADIVTATKELNGTINALGILENNKRIITDNITNYKNIEITINPNNNLTADIIDTGTITYIEPEDNESAGSYGVTATIAIPEGYYKAHTIKKDISMKDAEKTEDIDANDIKAGITIPLSGGGSITGAMQSIKGQTIAASANDITFSNNTYHDGDYIIKGVSLDIDLDNMLSTTKAAIKSNDQTIVESENGKIQTIIPNLTELSNTVTIESGYYAKDYEVKINNTTTPTPSVNTENSSNDPHKIIITPKVKQIAPGYNNIDKDYITGTPLEISASQLVSGTLPINKHGVTDVTNYANVSLNLSGLYNNIQNNLYDVDDTDKPTFDPENNVYTTNTLSSIVENTSQTQIDLQTDLLSQINNTLESRAAAAIDDTAAGTDTSDATAVSADIIAGKTAYVNGVKLIGSLEGETKTATQNHISIVPSTKPFLSKVNIELPVYDGSINGDTYIPVEYIESNGSQYLNTNWIHQSNSMIVLDCEVTQSNRDSFLVLCGSYPVNYLDSAWAIFSRFNNTHTLAVGRTGSEAQLGSMTYGKRITIMAGGNSASYSNGSEFKTVSASGISDNGLAGSPMYLFANNENGVPYRHSIMKLYGAKFYTNGILQRDYIPAKNNIGKYGLYDKITNNFVTSSSATNFTGRDF